MKALRTHIQSLRRARAHITILTLLGLVAASAAFAPALRAAPEDPKPGTAEGSAQRPPKRENVRPEHRRPPGPLALFDTDRDGRISAAEIAAASAVLSKLDTDGDGQLTGRELHPPRPPRPPGAPDGGPDGPPDGARGDGPRGDGPPPHRHPPGPQPDALDSAP